MTAPGRARFTEGGVRFHLREPIDRVHMAGCFGVGGLGAGVGFVLFGVLFLVLGTIDPELVNLAGVACYGAPLFGALVGWLYLKGWMNTDLHLHVDGRSARVTQAGKVRWSGPIGSVQLEEGTPYWTLIMGDDTTQVINPPEDLTWLLAELEKDTSQAGSEKDVPAMLARRAEARSQQS